MSAPPSEGFAERLLPEVQRVMDVGRYESGPSGSLYLARFSGRLRIDSLEAFERLEPAFARAGSTVLLRQDGDSQVVVAVEQLKARKPDNPLVNLVLFLLTLGTVLYVGLGYAQGYLQQTPTARDVPVIGEPLPLALLYAGSLLGILVAHEFGHFLMGRYHQTAVTLPYFIPFPGGLFGTFGAFIQLRSPPKNRRVLMDIGLAGPVAGLVIAVPVLLLGLALSQVGPLPASRQELAGTFLEGNSLLYLGAKYLIKGELLPQPLDYQGVAPIVYWLRNLVFGVGGAVGVPIPIGGLDVQLHPMALAGWAGFLVTGLNLIPTGQLDGGHVLYSLLGTRAAALWPLVIAALIGLTLVWNGWLLFAGLTFLMGRTYATPLDDVTPLDGRRRALAVFGLVLFFLIFTPVPIVPLAGR